MAETTEFGSALAAALEARKSELVWKGKDGNDINMMDMDYQALQSAYTHTMDMLYNEDKFTVGKFAVKRNIRKFINNCNAELLKRYILHDCNIDILKTNVQLIDYIRTKKIEYNLKDSDSVTLIFNGLPQEFSTVTISDLMMACFDKLDVINKKMISDRFILAQGIWLTNDEKKELTEIDTNGKRRNWMDVIKERLILNNVNLRVDPKGFSYSEFRNLIHLPKVIKISETPSDALKLLKNKVFILLDADIDYHVAKWMEIKENLEKVAEVKHFTLKTRNYENKW